MLVLGRYDKFTTDANLLTPQNMDELLFNPFGLALGETTRRRLQTQAENYDYYDGKQYRNDAGVLVYSSELETPAGADYKPTRYATNYFKAFIDRKAKWQMGGKHGVHVPRPQVDKLEDTLLPGYTPSDAQVAANKKAEDHERLINQLWRENRMRARLLQAARERLIADRVVCKIAYNPSTGRLKWIWRPDFEFIPINSDDDFEEMIGCYFVRQKIEEINGEEVNAIQIQKFSLEGDEDSRECFLEEAIYAADDLRVLETVIAKSSMGIDFIPVVTFSVYDLIAESDSDSEISAMREQNDILNQMNDDSLDSLKFEMFGITVMANAAPGSSKGIKIAPGAVIELTGAESGVSPTMKTLESKFNWNTAHSTVFDRVKAAMHEISGIPQVVPKEMNFGGINAEAMQIMYHDIINDTEEHWIAWEYGLEELHEKSIRYLQARLDDPRMKYDKALIRSIDDYHTKMNFVLPLPDNRAALVELLSDEMSNGLESQAGALSRLGVESVANKKQEIAAELREKALAQDPYSSASVIDPVEHEVVSLSLIHI